MEAHHWVMLWRSRTYKIKCLAYKAPQHFLSLRKFKKKKKKKNLEATPTCKCPQPSRTLKSLASEFNVGHESSFGASNGVPNCLVPCLILEFVQDAWMSWWQCQRLQDPFVVVCGFRVFHWEHRFFFKLSPPVNSIGNFQKIQHKCSHMMGWTINPLILQTLVFQIRQNFFVRAAWAVL